MAARVARLQARMVEQDIDQSPFNEIEALFWQSGYANSEDRWRVCLVPCIFCSYGLESCPPIQAADGDLLCCQSEERRTVSTRRSAVPAPQVLSHREASVILAEHAAPLQFGHDHTPELLEHAREYRRRNYEAVAATRLE